MLDWARVDPDPTAHAVRRVIAEDLRSRCKGVTYSKDKVIEQFVRGHDVLDIGVAEHTISHVDSPNWLHGKVVRWARKVVGIDTRAEVVDALVARGLDVRCVDATGNVDLGIRFSRVVMGEIIEHVDDPVGLLRFAARHLTPEGRILVTTPNPFYFAWQYESWREGVFVPNAEHVRWVSPAMVLEIGRRAGLTLDSWWCLNSDPATLRRGLAAVMRVARWIPRLKETVAFSYIYELTAGS